MPEPFDAENLRLNGSPGSFSAVTKSDATIFNPPSRKVMIGGAGTLVVEDMRGVESTLTGLAVGIWHDMRVTKIKAASTATNIAIGW